MKPTTINVQITKCPKQFEAVRLGLDASLDAGETVESAIKAATEQLNAIYAEMYAPQQKVAQNAEKEATNEKPAAGTTREILTMSDNRVQSICKRLEAAAGDEAKINDILKQVQKFYAPDADAQKCIDLAAQLNKRLTPKN